MNYSYLIPANSKKSMLMLGVFTWTDLIILGLGLFVSFIAVLFVPMDSIVASIVAILPGAICALLVFPVPNYHNMLTLLMSIYKFYTTTQNYVWKGWCFLDGSENDK